MSIVSDGSWLFGLEISLARARSSIAKDHCLDLVRHFALVSHGERLDRPSSFLVVFWVELFDLGESKYTRGCFVV